MPYWLPRLAMLALLLIDVTYTAILPAVAGPKTAAPQKSVRPAPKPAPTPPGDTSKIWGQFCAELGSLAMTMAEARDNGAPLSVLLSRAQQVEDSKMAPYLRTLTLEIYEQRWMTPARVRQTVELECFQAAAQ